MSRSETVWIVDDDRSIRWVLEKALQQEGMTTQSFDSADGVMSRLARQAPDVIISDIRMPGASGLDLLARIREQHPRLPVIIMTAHSDLDSAVASYQGGAFEYLPKPFDVDEAVSLVKRANQHAQEQQGLEVATDPIELAIGQDPQQAGLGVGWHVADLVEEQSAAVGLLEAPAPQVGRAGERALFMAEQLGFHQVLGDRRHVQGDERRSRPRAVAMQGMGYQLLAGAGLAVDQHCDVGVAQAPDGAEHLLHRRRFADDLRGASQGRGHFQACLLYTSPSPRDRQKSRMPSSA